ncbi:MAG TPA: TonB-dependent receptor [Bryobacteraceae bacterium]|nr:TonB-dependent receptor [Bryobacteraceae bacterium]
MRFKTAIVILTVTLAASFIAWGQSDRGTITGTVSDPAGAVVANAPVQAKNADTGETYSGATSNTGNYTVSQLPAGNYELTVTVPGFKKYTRQNLAIQVAQIARIDVTLEVGSATESVTVSEAAPLLNTETGDLAHNVTTKFLDDVPLLTISGNIRNPSVFAQLIPGTYMTGQEMRISGSPNNTQSLRVEGQEANNSGIPAIPGQSQQSVDAVQEVTIQTSNYAAEYGQAGGGVINMTMKSGTNQFHGSGYDYIANEAFNAGVPFTDSPTGNPVPRVRRHDYGFTIGGPVWIPKLYNGHDKTFFFFNWEQYRETLYVSTLQETVPTAAYRQGNFATAMLGVIGTDPTGQSIRAGEIYDPNTTRTVNGQSIRDPFPGNTIPQARFDPLSVKIQSLIPQPIGQFANAISNNYIPTMSGKQIEDIPALKIDQVTGPKGKLTFYWSRKWLSQPFSTTFGNADGLGDPLTTAIASFIRAHTYRLNYDYTLTPTTLLHFGAGYFDTDFWVPSVTTSGAVTNYNAASQLGLQGAIVNQFFPAISGLLATNGTGGMKNIGSEANTHQWTERPTFNTSLTMVRGNHTYKTGAEFRIEGYPVENLGNTTGSYVFAGDQTSLPYLNGAALQGQTPGFGYASFLLGAVKQVSINNPVYPKLGKNQLGLYVQDSWKISRKITFDYGLRYDYSTYLREQYGRAPFFSPTTPNSALGNILGAAIFDGNGNGHCNCSLAKNYPWAFGPRLGLAYKINNKTVFRGGFGIVYNGTSANNGAATTLGASSNTVAAPAFGSAITTMSAGIPRSFDPAPWPNLNPALYNLVSPTPVPYGADWLDPNAGRPPRQYQWSAGFQREITRDVAVEAEYVGNHGVWWESLGLINLNAIPVSRLAAAGLNINSTSDVSLLTLPLSNAQVVARGLGNPPYPGFPLTQTLGQALRPFPQYTTINTLFNPLGDTWYESLQAKATKRMSHGLLATSTFTWSKTLTSGSERDPNPGSTGNAVFNDVFNRPNNKYLSIYDQPFQFILSLTYVTPKLNTNKVLSWVARDWTYGAFMAYRSGLPLQVPAANNNLGLQVFQSTFANRVPGQPLFTHDLNCHCFDPNATFVLNPAAWADPAAGQFGTSAAYYSDYRKQRRPAENMNLGRTFRLTERVALNVRIELTNIFNRPVVNDPTNTNAKAPQVRLPNGNAASGFGYINTTTTVGGAGVAGVVNVPGERTGLMVARITF